jgi:hypothetical protein
MTICIQVRHANQQPNLHFIVKLKITLYITLATKNLYDQKSVKQESGFTEFWPEFVLFHTHNFSTCF